MSAEKTRAAIVRVERDGEVLSGIRTGIKANSFTIRQLSARKRENGLLVTGDGVESWEARGLMEQDGEIFVIGSPLSGIALDAALADEQRLASPEALNDVRRVAHAMAAGESRISGLPLHTRAFILLDNDRVFIPPPEIIRSIVENADVAEQVRIKNRFVHPDLGASENHSFFLASLVYLALTGATAFEGESSEEVNGRIRSGRPVPANARRLELEPAISDTVTKALTGSGDARSAADWAGLLDSWRAGVTRELSPDERIELETRATTEIERINRSFGRNETIRRNWRKWALIAVIAAVVLSIPGTIIRNALRPRATAGFAPAEVVEAFYWGINELDHMLMEDAVTDGAGRPLVREVTNLFVITRQRMSVEGDGGLVDARLWQEEGRPELDPGRAPYGVTSLSLEPLAAADGEVAFSVHYERWLPNPASGVEESPPSALYVGYLITDEVRLRQDRDDWVIYEMNTVSSVEAR